MYSNNAHNTILCVVSILYTYYYNGVNCFTEQYTVLQLSRGTGIMVLLNIIFRLISEYSAEQWTAVARRFCAVWLI